MNVRELGLVIAEVQRESCDSLCLCACLRKAEGWTSLGSSAVPDGSGSVCERTSEVYLKRRFGGEPRQTFQWRRKLASYPEYPL